MRVAPADPLLPSTQGPCTHGGAFFDAIGAGFEDLSRRHRVINADVLDAWFPPSPRVVAAIAPHLEWLIATSPPTGCEGLVRAIAAARGVPEACVLPGAGSSELIYLALRRWLRPTDRALLLDPTYGEYAHVLERVVGCRLERFALRREDGYRLDADRLVAKVREGFDAVVIVNPNSPTGVHAPRASLLPVLAAAPPHTRFWIDETYVEYVGQEQSLEPVAAASASVVVCKSMSKVYALSGLRVAYLVGPAPVLADLRALTPPWAVGLLGQVAAVEALHDQGYYAARWQETHGLRAALAQRLDAGLGVEVVPGAANFVLLHLPASGPAPGEVVRRCREQGLFVRDFAELASLRATALRIAVKDAATNARMLAILASVLRG